MSILDYHHDEPRTLRTCQVANRGCERPVAMGSAGARVVTSVSTAADMKGPICECYVCGHDVCRACSSVVSRRTAVMRVNGGHAAKRRVRMCADCIRDGR